MMNKRIGKFIVTNNMLIGASKTVKKVLSELEILESKTEDGKIIYTALSPKFDPIPERNPIPWYRFNIVNNEIVLERKR